MVDIIIIGGGAAGLMAAVGAAQERKGSVVVLEKMPRPGRKIMITGKGRCNYSNMKEWDGFSQHIRSKANFIRPAFYNMSPSGLLGFMESNGLETVVERGDRMFPASHRSADVVDTLTGAVRKAGAKLLTDWEVATIEYDTDGNTGSEEGGKIFSVTSNDGRSIQGKRLIIATGGLSYPTTGSTGDGYRWAAQLGHSIKTCFPSLTALVPKGYKEYNAKGHIPRSTPLTGLGMDLCGIHLKNVNLTLKVNGNEVRSEFGDMDFTDGGIEGPIGFEVSRDCVRAMLNGGKAALSIDMKAGVPEEELLSRIKGLWTGIGSNPRSENVPVRALLKVLLEKLMPRELIPAFLKSHPDLMQGRKGHERVSLEKLAGALKAWEMEVDGYVGYERCVVTAGGVSTDELVAKSMESKLVPGLYFCGEVVDMDAGTGGYNLHIAFASGLLAGQSAAKSL